MSATATLIFSASTNPAALTETARFRKADFLIFEPQGLALQEGYEIACSLMIDVTITETIAGFPVTTSYGLREIPIDLYLDTAQVLRLPGEITKGGFEQFLVMATSYPVSLKIYAIDSGCLSCAESDALLEEINARTQTLELRQLLEIGGLVASLTNALAQNIAIGLLATELGVALAPITAGLSLAIPPSVLPELAAGSGVVTPAIGLLTGAGLPLPLP